MVAMSLHNNSTIQVGAVVVPRLEGTFDQDMPHRVAIHCQLFQSFHVAELYILMPKLRLSLRDREQNDY